MTGFTDVFGGSTVQAADVSYRAVALTASATTVWPQYATSNNQMARLMDVTASSAGYSLATPDATLTSVGQDFFIANRGSNSFTLKDFSGNSLSVLTAGQIRYFYLTDNSTQAGTWTSVLFGSVSSNLDASALSGYGIKAIGSTLNFAPVTSVISGNTTVTTSDRAKVYIWTGGAGTLTLPLASTSGADFSIEVRNQGTGILTLTPSGADVIDGSGTVALQVNESCFIHAGVGNWYTVGRGRNTQFNFTQLLKSVTGGTVTLSLTEAANTVQTYSGTLTSNCTVTLPAYVQVYFISNQTSGAFSLTFRTPNTGTTLSLPTGQNAVVFCDGTNVINASTSISGVSSIAFGAGSASNPSASFGTTTNGIYSSGTNEVAVAINGVYAGKFSTTGLNVVNALTVGTGLTVVSGGASITGSTTAIAGNDALALTDTSSTTGFKAIRLRNTTGGIDVGVQNNAGTWVSGATANDAVVVGRTGISFSANDGAATQMRLSSTGLAVTGTLGVTKGSVGVVATFTGGTQPAYIFSSNSYGWFAAEASVLNAVGVNAGTNSVDIVAGGVTRGTFSSTGLAVTGNVSTSQNLKFTSSVLGAASDYSISNYLSNLIYNVPTGSGHVWAINNGDKMTLDASGNFLVGTSTYALSNSNNLMLNASGGALYAQHASGAASGTAYSIFAYNATQIGSITQSGTTAVAYNTTSDHRLKTNIRPADARRFMDIKFHDYEWIDGRHDCGPLAHELQEIYPDLVTGKKDATEIRTVEITPAVPAVTEQVLVSEAVLNDEGEEIEAAVYETVEVTPEIPAVTEEQEFPVYQQVNYTGLISRTGVRVQALQRTVDSQAVRIDAQDQTIATLIARIEALEART